MSEITKNRRESSSSSDCVLCCEHITTYSIGPCNHPTCYRCASRMRVLAKQKYCAVCRADMPSVVFSDHLALFEKFKLQHQKKLYHSKFGIHFETAEGRSKFDSLLMYECALCDDGVDHGDFNKLRTHSRKSHKKQYCDICVDKLHIFPREFRCYSREEMVTHRRTGDPDNKSYKGHPGCKFCDERYLDNDELLSHLRKHHFWCHFCEKDGKQNYYPHYPSLREHFREEHFLCEEDRCKTEEYTAVFRNKLDLQAHIIEKHQHGTGKQQSRRQRNVDIQLDYRMYRDRSSPVDEMVERGRQKPSNTNRPTQPAAAPPTSAESHQSGPTDLETLYQAKSSPTIAKPQQNTIEIKKDVSRVEEDFPSLHVSSSSAPAPSWGAQSSGSKTSDGESKKKPGKTPSTAGEKSWNKTLPSMEDTDAFPTLPSTKPQKSDSRGAKPKQINRPTMAKVAKKEPPPGLQTHASKSVASPTPKRTLSAGKSEPPEIPVAPNNGSPQPSRSVSHTDDRNARLIQMIQSCLSDEQLAYFRELSAEFRRSQIPSQLYYEDMSLLFGDNLKRVFSELVSLLPDPKKQQELFELHNARKAIVKRNGNENSSSKAYSSICKDLDMTTKAPPVAVQQTSAARAPNPETDFPALPAGAAKKKYRNYRTPTHVSAPNAWGSR